MKSDRDRFTTGRLQAVLGRIGLLVVAAFLVGFWLAPVVQDRAVLKRRKVVRFWHMWTAEWKVKVDMVVDRFNKSQDEYEVEALSVPSAGADSKFLLGVMGGDPPDVMAQWNPVIPAWADAGLIIPLDDLMSPGEKATFDREAYPVVRKIGTYKGKVFGMSIGTNMNALYYRPDELAKVGIEPKEAFSSLEALDAAGAKLDKFDSSGRLQRLGWMPVDIRMFMPMFGGSLYDEARGQITVDTPENRRALEYLVASRKRLGFAEVIRFNSGVDTASSTATWPFITGAYAITVAGQWYVKQIEDYAPDLKYATAPVPPPKGGVPYAGVSNGNFMIVPRGAKEPAGAWAFIRFWSGLADPEVAAEFYTWGGWLPLSPAVANAPIYQAYIREHPQFKTFVDLMASENIQVLPPVPYQTFLNDQVLKAEDVAVRGSVPPDRALADLQEKVAEELRRRKASGEEVTGD